MNGAGNIPTPVGKTLCHGTTGKRTRKHPHARGEDCFSPPCAVLVTETSPRPWGRRFYIIFEPHQQRNIPTPVGKTRLTLPPRDETWKHPHARGEDREIQLEIESKTETSPRPWGRLKFSGTRLDRKRNIPTPVGKTPPLIGAGLRVRKHPHARGEDCKNRDCPEDVSETSPRPWGRLNLISAQRLKCGNIPTPVGKTAIYQLFSNGNNYILWPFQFQIFKDSSKKLLFLLLSGIGRFFLEN